MTPRLPLSVAIITLNEESNLPRCLASIRDLAQEIVVVDSGSTDRTAAIAREAGAVFQEQPWQGHIAQKNIAFQRCTQPWILCLDADEALSPELEQSIRQLFSSSGPAQDGYWVNRRTFYLGEWIRHAWYPEWRLRLARKSNARWTGLDPHDRLEVDGPTARLEGDLLHYPFRDYRDHLSSVIQHAQTMAKSYAREGRRFRWHKLLFSPWATFFKHLVLKQGWRDGWRGWLISLSKFINVSAKYAFLLEAERRDADGKKKP